MNCDYEVVGTDLQFHQPADVGLEVAEVDFGHCVDVLIADLARHCRGLTGNKLKIEPGAKQRVFK